MIQLYIHIIFFNILFHYRLLQGGEYLLICSLCYTVGPCWLSTLYIVNGFPGGTNGKEPTCQCRRHKRCGFNPWVGKILWRRAWQPTPVFLPRESSWTEKPGRLQSIGSQRVRHNWSDLACMHTIPLVLICIITGSLCLSATFIQFPFSPSLPPPLVNINLIFFLWVCFWSIVDPQHYVSSWSAYYLKIIITVNLVAICQHTKMLHYYWL